MADNSPCSESYFARCILLTLFIILFTCSAFAQDYTQVPFEFDIQLTPPDVMIQGLDTGTCPTEQVEMLVPRVINGELVWEQISNFRYCRLVEYILRYDCPGIDRFRRFICYSNQQAWRACDCECEFDPYNC